MIRPLAALGKRARGRLLDVGCGLGYVPHFWMLSGRGDAVGVEPALYGRVGRDLLGVEIYSSALCAEQRFDLVYASEVIEHVASPLVLLRELVEKLTPDGILVLTTPSADYIAPHRPPWQVIAMLSPGEHSFLLSARSLRDLIIKAGLAHCVIKDIDGRLMAWASRQPLPAISLDAFDWDEYLGYLDRIGSNRNRSVACGALYRLFKDSLNTGRTARAKAALAQLHLRASRHYDSDPFLADPAAMTAARSLAERLQMAPAWLGGALLFSGVFNEVEQGPPQRSCEALATAILLLEHDAEIGAQFTGEAAAFLPYAKTQYCKALERSFSATAAGSRPAPSQTVKAGHLCLFAHYDQHDRVADYTIHYVRELGAAGFDVIFATAAKLSASELAKIAPYVVDTIVRDNIGHDLGSWMEAYRRHPADPRRLLLLCNDSVYGPLWDFKTTLAKLVSIEADFYGMVTSNEHVPHIQSWFLLFTPRAHQSQAFKRFMASLRHIRTKSDVIDKFELQLTRTLESNGLTSHALYDPRKFKSPPRIASNPSHFLWRRLLESYGVPFVKIALLRDNPMRLNLTAVGEVVRRRSEALTQNDMPHAVTPNGSPAFSSRPQIYYALVQIDDLCARRGWQRFQRMNVLLLAFLRRVDHALMLARHIVLRTLILTWHLVVRCASKVRRLLDAK